MQCPAEYKKRYIDDIREETEAMIRGRIVHEFIEKAYDKNWFYIEERMGEEVLQVDKENVPEKYTQYGDYLANFYQMEQRRLQKMKRQHNGNYLDFFKPIEQEIKIEPRVDGHTLVGIIDAVFKIGEDDYMLVDYKTGNSYSPWTNREQRETEINYYGLATHHARSLSVSPSKGRFSYVGDGGEKTYQITDQSLHRTRKIVNRVAEKIKEGHFECSKDKCKMCS